MKHIIFLFTIILTTALVGCDRPKSNIVQPQPEEPVQAEPAPPIVEPQPELQPPQPSIPHSTVWVRGYNDGYDGNWLGPASWLVSNEYRAGWSAGNRDMKEGKPHRIHH